MALNGFYDHQYFKLRSIWTERLNTMNSELTNFQSDNCSLQCGPLQKMTELSMNAKAKTIKLAEEDLSILDDLWILNQSLNELTSIIRSQSPTNADNESENSRSNSIARQRTRIGSSLTRELEYSSNSNKCRMESTIVPFSEANVHVQSASDLIKKITNCWSVRDTNGTISDRIKSFTNTMYFPKKRCSAVEIKRNFRRNEPQKRSFDSGFHEVTTMYKTDESCGSSRDTLGT